MSKLRLHLKDLAVAQGRTGKQEVRRASICRTSQSTVESPGRAVKLKSQDKTESTESPRTGDLDLADVCCEVYRSWLLRMMQSGGPGPMEDVAWYLVSSHVKLCPACHDNQQFASFIKVVLAQKMQAQES